MAIHRGEHWKPEEDRRLFELVEAGKSWVLISAILNRSITAIRIGYRMLKRRAAYPYDA